MSTHASLDLAAALCTSSPSDALVATTPTRVAMGFDGAAVAVASIVTSTAETKEYCILKKKNYGGSDDYKLVGNAVEEGW